jgi:integrase
MPLYRRKGSKHWWISITVAGIKTRKSTGTEDRCQAEEFEAREHERLWRVHKLGDTGAVLWSTVVKRYLAESDKPRTRDRAILTWFATYLDKEPISAINLAAIEKLRELLTADGMSKSTVNRFMNTLRAVLSKCVEWQHLPAVPKMPMFKLKPNEPRWLTPLEFGELRKHLPEHLKLAADLAVTTGLRMRSMGKLLWSRIDLNKAVAWIPGNHMKCAKAHGLPLSPAAVDALKALRALNPEGDYVFVWNGEPIDNFCTASFKKAVKAAKLEPLRWHDLRHTFASWAVQQGVSMAELMELGGWKSHRMVLNYVHLNASHLASAAAKIGTFWTQSAKELEQKEARKN